MVFSSILFKGRNEKKSVMNINDTVFYITYTIYYSNTMNFSNIYETHSAPNNKETIIKMIAQIRDTFKLISTFFNHR
jgi:hypothetical protein